VRRSIQIHVWIALCIIAGLADPLRAQPPASPSGQPPAGPAACLIIGEWQSSRSPQETITIRSDGHGGIVLKTAREWTGSYDATSGRLDLTYNLTASEIQEGEDKGQVPQWARDQIASQPFQEHMNLIVNSSGNATHKLSITGKMHGEKAFFEEGRPAKIVPEEERSLGDTYTTAPGLYKSALCRAMQVDGKSIDNAPTTEVAAIDSYAVMELLSKLLPFVPVGEDFPDKRPVKYTTTITLGNHAAMLVLRDAFIERMQKEKAKLANLGETDSLIVAAVRAPAAAGISGRPVKITTGPVLMLWQYLKWGIKGAGSALGQVLVLGPKPDLSVGPLDLIAHPHSVFDIPLEKAIDDSYLEGVFLSNCDRDHYEETAIQEAIPKFKAAVDYSLAMAQHIKDDDVVALLELTGNHFQPVVDYVKPKLIEPAGSGKPDRPGQIQLELVSGVLEQLQLERSYADLNTQSAIALALAAAPFFGIEASLAMNTAVLAQGGNQLANCLAVDAEEAKAALGHGAVLGSDRVKDARRLRDERFNAAMHNILMGLGGLTMDTLGLMAKSAATLARGEQIANQLERNGFESLKSLSPEDQAAFLAYTEKADQIRATNGEAALTPTERNALSSVEQSQTPAAPGGTVTGLTSSPETTVRISNATGAATGTTDTTATPLAAPPPEPAAPTVTAGNTGTSTSTVNPTSPPTTTLGAETPVPIGEAPTTGTANGAINGSAPSTTSSTVQPGPTMSGGETGPGASTTTTTNILGLPGNDGLTPSHSEVPNPEPAPVGAEVGSPGGQATANAKASSEGSSGAGSSSGGAGGVGNASGNSGGTGGGDNSGTGGVSAAGAAGDSGPGSTNTSSSPPAFEPNPSDAVLPLNPGKSIMGNMPKRSDGLFYIQGADGKDIAEIDDVIQNDDVTTAGTLRERTFLVEEKSVEGTPPDPQEWVDDQIVPALNKYDRALKEGQNLPPQLGVPSQAGIGIKFTNPVNSSFQQTVESAIHRWELGHPGRTVRISWYGY
jgi:hypothetical protein